MNRKLLILGAFAGLLFFSCKQDKGKYDERAIALYDKMSETIGNMESCSFTLSTFSIRKDGNEYRGVNDVYLKGPDKMYIHNKGTAGEFSYWFDGSKMGYYNFTKNEFDTIPAPEYTIAAIDSIHRVYGIIFPAADFFYPTFTDDMMNNFNEIYYAGTDTLDGVICEQTEMINDRSTVAIWFEKDTYLPHKLVISSKIDTRYYDGNFSNWRVNPKLSDILFEFAPPPGAKHAALKPKK